MTKVNLSSSEFVPRRANESAWQGAQARVCVPSKLCHLWCHEEDFAKTAKVRCEGAHPLSALWAGEVWPQLSYHTTYLGRMAGSVNSQRFLNRYIIGQYASSPGHMAYCYAGLAISSLAVAGATTSTHSCLPTEGWLRLCRPGAWFCAGVVYTRPNIPVQRRSPNQALTGPGVE